MGFKGCRDFVQALEKSGDIIHVKQEVDWDLEIGAITRHNCELSGPAILFDKIKDYPGHRVLGSPMANFRLLAIGLGLEPDTPLRNIFAEYTRRMGQSIPPITVKDGPCKENIVKAADLDLFSFPSPMIHDGDGGRYIATWSLDITRDLRSNWINWGMYRVMVYDRKTLVGDFTPGKHIDIHLKEYMAQRKPMPIAIVVGADPMSSLTSASYLNVGQDEVNLAGALNQEPVELIKCETIDLMVPAHAEIVIEGEVSSGTLYPRVLLVSLPATATGSICTILFM